MSKVCGIYDRVSTNNQAEKEFSSCEAQEEKIRSYIASQEGWTIYKVYSDAGYTGANMERPALQEMLQDLKDGKIDMIVIYKIDRLTRSPKDFYQLMEFLEETNTDFISITERFDTSTPTGRLLRNIMLTFAQFERELTSERTKDKLLERARKGMCPGGRAVHGYDRKKKKFIVNKKEAKDMELMFATYVQTKSLTQTYNILKKKGVTNKAGKFFSKSNIWILLRNPIYMGKVRHNNELYPGLHKAIISEELFTLAQSLHKDRVKKYRIYKNFLFGGLITCDECGSHMTGCFTNKWKNDKMKRYYYYRCTSVQKYDANACSTKQVSADRIEQYTLENLDRIAVDKEYIESLLSKLKSEASGGGLGLKPKQPEFQLSAEVVTQAIQSFVSEVKSKTGVNRNLLSKRTIQDICYSTDKIKISLLLQPNSIDSGVNSTAADQIPKQAAKLLEMGENREKALVGQFAVSTCAPHLGLEPPQVRPLRAISRV